jgi:hypothetical protein
MFNLFNILEILRFSQYFKADMRINHQKWMNVKNNVNFYKRHLKGKNDGPKNPLKNKKGNVKKTLPLYLFGFWSVMPKLPSLYPQPLGTVPQSVQPNQNCL